MSSGNANKDELPKSFINIAKANAQYFLWIYIFVCALPFLFADLKFDQYNIGSTQLIFILLL